VKDKKKEMERIEKICKSAKIDTNAQGRIKPSVLKKIVKKENTEILFNLIWADKLTNSESQSTKKTAQSTSNGS
jgi:hypothetical protein